MAGAENSRMRFKGIYDKGYQYIYEIVDWSDIPSIAQWTSFFFQNGLHNSFQFNIPSSTAIRLLRAWGDEQHGNSSYDGPWTFVILTGEEKDYDVVVFAQCSDDLLLIRLRMPEWVTT